MVENDRELEARVGRVLERSDPARITGRLDRDVYSTKELAAATGIHFETILAAIKRGELPAINFGGSAGNRILHESAIAWLKQLEQRHTAEARELSAAS